MTSSTAGFFLTCLYIIFYNEQKRLDALLCQYPSKQSICTTNTAYKREYPASCAVKIPVLQVKIQKYFFKQDVVY